MHDDSVITGKNQQVAQKHCYGILRAHLNVLCFSSYKVKKKNSISHVVSTTASWETRLLSYTHVKAASAEQTETSLFRL